MDIVSDDMDGYMNFQWMADRNQTETSIIDELEDTSRLDGGIPQAQEIQPVLIATTNTSNTQPSVSVIDRFSNEHLMKHSGGSVISESLKPEIPTAFLQINADKVIRSDVPSSGEGSVYHYIHDGDDSGSYSQGTTVHYDTWNYNDDIMVLNLSKGDDHDRSLENCTTQEKGNLLHQGKPHLDADDNDTGMNVPLSQEKSACEMSSLNNPENKNVVNGTDVMFVLHKPTQFQESNSCISRLGDSSDKKKVDNTLSNNKIRTSDEPDTLQIKAEPCEEKIKCDSELGAEPNVYNAKKRKIEMTKREVANLDSEEVKGTSEGNTPMSTSDATCRSPIKTSLKQSKFEIEETHEEEDTVNCKMGENTEAVKVTWDALGMSTGEESDMDVDDLPVDYSMHSTLVRENLSKSGTTDITSIKHERDIDDGSDPDQESFCSSLKLKSVSAKTDSKEMSCGEVKSENNGSDSDESDGNADGCSSEDLEKVDEFVLDKLLTDQKDKKKFKQKMSGNKNAKEKVYNCDTCLKTFTRKSSWRHHVKTHVDKVKECEVCGKKIKYSGNMLSHLKTHSGERPFKCEVCEKTFTRAASLYTHARSHTGEKTFLCEICGKSFGDKSHYRRHLKIHSGIKPFKCEVCHMAFTQCWSLKSHMLSHLEEKPHICSLCGKGYTQKAYLDSHVRSHTGERPYACNVCGKSFSDSSCMRRHAKSHIGEKSFVCELCGKSFGRGWNLTVHMRIHYDDKRFECFVCGKAFVQKINLDKHILTHPVGGGCNMKQQEVLPRSPVICDVSYIGM